MSRVIYLPGLAADKNLFIEMQKDLKGEVFPWIKPFKNESLKQYSIRCAQDWGITKKDILVGFSFGGMVAKEIREAIPFEKNLMPGLFLLSSCRNKYALDSKFIKRSKWIVFVPNFLLKIMAIYIGPNFTARTLKEKKQLSVLKTMAKCTSIDFLKWATKACSKWNNTNTNIPLIEIHGENDLVIPYSKHNSDIIIKGASHLICYTHSKEVTDIIKEIIYE